MRNLVPATLLGLLGSISVLGVQAKGEEANFLVLPVTTDLQRSTFAIDKNTTACVLINGSALRRDDNVIRWTTLDFDALRKALLPLRKGRDAGVTFGLLYQSFEENDQEFRKLLRWMLVGFGQEIGFRNARWVMSGPGKLPWEEKVAAIKEKTAGKADADEPSTGNDLVKVHPVRTVLSRHLFDNADCVVTIIPPFAEDWDGTLSPEMNEAIRRHVSDLKLENKSHLMFRVRWKGANSKAVDEAVGRFSTQTAKALAKSFGFNSHNVESGRAPVKYSSSATAAGLRVTESQETFLWA